MEKVAAVCSGQGAQYPGMGRELYDTFGAAREVYACGSDILGFDLAQMSFEGSEEALAATKVSQPVIFALSLAAFAAGKDSLPAPSAVMGHSLGEFAALCLAGAYSMEDGFRIIAARAAAMDAVSGTVKGAMYAILGSDEAAVEAACKEAGGFVLPVNFNLPTQTVISGEEAAAAAAAEILAGAGAKAVRLSVSAAFHTAMMAPAAEQLKAAVSGISYKETTVPFYSNLTGGKLEIEDYPDYFARHMVSPVQFVKQVAAIAADGIGTCIEYGPKKTAAALVKKNNRALAAYNVEDMKSLESCVKKLG